MDLLLTHHRRRRQQHRRAFEYHFLYEIKKHEDKISEFRNFR